MRRCVCEYGNVRMCVGGCVYMCVLETCLRRIKKNILTCVVIYSTDGQMDSFRSTVVVTLSVSMMCTHLYYCSMRFLQGRSTHSGQSGHGRTGFILRDKISKNQS